MTALLYSSSNAYSGELDNYYLEQFGEISSASSRPALKTVFATGAQKCGMPLRKGLRTDWTKLESSTQKTLAKYLAKPVLSGSEAVPYISPGGHFAIHYTTSGIDAPPLTTTPPNAVPDWVITVADIFENVYNAEVTSFGYTAPAPLPYPVYLQQRAPTDFGFTESDILTGQSATSFIVIDNDFADSVYHPNNGVPGLQITAAHEFHHAIQYHYNFFFEAWYAEATSSWMEDEVYDTVNQLYDYSRNYLQNPATSLDIAVSVNTGGGYGRWIFNRLLAENYNPVMIRSIWEKLRNTPAQNGFDIPMLPVIDNTLLGLQSSLATEFTSFAKRLYDKKWTSHTTELNLLYSVPLKIESTYRSYPVNGGSAPSPRATLPHYSMSYFKFIPTSTVTNLTVTVSRTAGIETALFRKTSAGITEIAINSSSSPTSYSYVVNGFGFLDPNSDEVVLMAANATAVDNHMVAFSSDGSTVNVSDPPPPGVGGFDSGSSGCFIATAAYGSYLHPKVVILREFRDNYLLTNPPGRALIAAYYKLSPPLADFITRNETLRNTVRLFLAPLIFAVTHLWISLATIIACSATILLMAGRWRKKRLLFPQKY